MRRTVVLAVVAAALAASSPALASGPPSTPFTQDPLGPITDVTTHWQAYQPATAFCIKPNVPEASGPTGATATGANPACRRSGFPANAKGLYLVHIRAPLLCPGCRRLFIDYSKIPAGNQPPAFYAHGHTYFHLDSFNWGYTAEPIDHSPNIKTFTNDKLIAPNGSPQAQLIGAFDLHFLGYVAETAHFVHSTVQGPWYVGPWYLNQAGQRISGAYVDVDVIGATPLPDPSLNAIGYQAGFGSGDAGCPTDQDAYYVGCADHFGFSAEEVDPYAHG